MSKKGVLEKFLTTDSLSACEYFIPFPKNPSITAAVFAPMSVV